MPNGVSGVFDYTTTVDVEVAGSDEFGGELETATEAEVLAGANLCAIGNDPAYMEICAFTTVTLLGSQDSLTAPRNSRTFRLNGFRRGLLGTTERIANHGKLGGQFMLLDPGLMEFVPTELALAGTRQAYKIVPTAGTTSDGSPTTLTVAANSSLSAPVANLAAARTAEAVVITFQRRSRARHRVLGSTSAPLVEGVESYEVVINPLTTNRTIVTATTTVNYTAAMQSDDGTTDAELSIAVYQMDAVRGRGRVATATLAQLGAQWLDENGTDTIVTEGLQRNIQTEN